MLVDLVVIWHKSLFDYCTPRTVVFRCATARNCVSDAQENVSNTVKIEPILRSLIRSSSDIECVDRFTNMSVSLPGLANKDVHIK